MRVYDHVIRVMGGGGLGDPGDLRVAMKMWPFGESMLRRTSMFKRVSADLKISNCSEQAQKHMARGVKRTLSEFVVTLLFDAFSPATLTEHAMELLCTQQLRVLAQGQPMTTVFVLPLHERVQVVGGYGSSIEIAADDALDVQVHASEELAEHLLGLVRTADGVFVPGAPSMQRVVKVACNVLVPGEVATYNTQQALGVR